jgi:hypothetical protein
LRIADYRGIDKTCDGFENDGEAKCDEEYSVKEGAKDFRSQPLWMISKLSVHQGFLLTPNEYLSVEDF